ncbi:MAG: methyltransferase type 11 [Alphaproteobacteria bacterium CG1_02_46_17]|nr:MAG: methyltransferase type 11 [Alphaproteobacteria bacterium CG1_02_46_17]
MTSATQTIQKNVQEYYGETLKGSSDLKTSACCPIDAIPQHLRPLLGRVHTEVQEKFYGCGSPIPQALEGMTVLDLGCGTGRDVYMLSQLVGSTGKVIGVDMTEAQLAVARQHIDYHMGAFDYEKPNVEFHHGYIEDLKSLGIADASVDVVVSNCVINLSANKEAVFREIFRVLKPGGELYFSDVFAGRRVPEHLQHDQEVLGECLGGALYIEDFRRMLRNIGCLDYRMMSKGRIALNDPIIEQKVGMIDFYSITVRAFKSDFEDICEDYGHVVTYKGTISETPHAFRLDDHHLFKTGMPERVCGNTLKMLAETRFAKHFTVIGDFSTHYGVFDCAPSTGTGSSAPAGACC